MTCVRIRSAQVEPVGIGERRGIPVGGGQRRPRGRRAASGRRPARRRWSRSGRPARQPARDGAILDRVRCERPIRPQRGQLVRVRQEVPEQRGGHALAGLDPTEHHHRGVRHDLVRPERRRRAGQHALATLERAEDVAAERRDRRPGAGADLAARRDAIDGRHDLVVPAEHDRGSVSTSSSASATTATASGPASSRRTSAVPFGARPSTSRRAPASTRSAKRAMTSGRRNAAANGSGGGDAPHRRATACWARRPGPSRTADRRP